MVEVQYSAFYHQCRLKIQQGYLHREKGRHYLKKYLLKEQKIYLLKKQSSLTLTDNSIITLLILLGEVVSPL